MFAHRRMKKRLSLPALDNSFKFATIKSYTETIIRQKAIEKDYPKGGDMG